MRYPWILFDADDTLFDFRRSARFAFSRTLEYFEIQDEGSHWEVYEYFNKETWTAFERQEITATELRSLRFERFLKAVNEYREPMEMSAYYLKELSQTKFMMDGAVDLIEDLLKKKLHLGLITNGLREVQRSRIASAQMGSFFEVIVVSDEIGVAKPQAGFFEHAFSEMDYPEKRQVLVVGDSLQSDIQGGENYGLDTCWFNPRNSANLTLFRPTYQIEKLEDLKKIL